MRDKQRALMRVQSSYFLAVLVSLIACPSFAQNEEPAGRAKPTAFCEDVNKRLKAPPSLETVLSYPIADLSALPSPLITPAFYMGKPNQPTLSNSFNPTPELVKQFEFYSGLNGGDPVQVLGFPDSSVHALWYLSGNDNCMGYQFFNAPKGEQAHLLPALPKLLHTEDEGLCRPHAGYLIEWQKQVGFLIRDEGEGFGAALRYVPLLGNVWGSGCRIDIKIDPTFAPTKIFRARTSRVSEALLKKELPNIVAEKFKTTSYSDDHFQYSNSTEPARDLTHHPVTQLYRSAATKIPFPTFGSQDAPGGLTYSPLTHALHGSVRLDGQSYLARVWMADYFQGMKWPIYLVVLYPIDENAVVIEMDGDAGDPAAASAIVELKPGIPHSVVEALK